jgi:hypothetical protein
MSWGRNSDGLGIPPAFAADSYDLGIPASPCLVKKIRQNSLKYTLNITE